MGTIDATTIFGRGENATFNYAVKGVNTASNYLFVDFLLLVMFIIIIFVLRNFELRDSFLTASVVTWLFSVMLWIGDLATFSRVVVCFSVVIIAIGMSYFKD